MLPLWVVALGFVIPGGLVAAWVVWGIMAQEKIVSFNGSIPLLQSAIMVAGDGGARVKIDIPDEAVARIMPELLAMRGVEIEVTLKKAKRRRNQPTARPEDEPVEDEFS